MLSQLRPTSISASQQEGVVVITISGPLSASGGDLLLRAEVADALYSGERHIVLDFSGLSTLDSSGLGELMRASAAVAECDGRMAWAACPRTMLDLLAITGVRLDEVLFADDLETAVEAMRSFGS